MGKEVRFSRQHIAVGGFPPESYYRGSASQAGVEIETVTGFDADANAADAAMREKLGNPKWQRPKGYRWNHAGPPGSKVMELVEEGIHGAIAHKGPGAEPRALRRGAGGGGATARAMAALTVYLVARDALRAGGVLHPGYKVDQEETYHFAARDGSVFILYPAGLFSRARRDFIAGPRKGQTEKISNTQVDEYRKQAEEQWGRYIPGSLLKSPRFIPGKQRTSLPVFIDDRGIRREAGWIDEEGVHYYDIPMRGVA
ncbi:MAG: HNH endonuclease [Planctomycetia bacterium]|nr:HNH endonuclease [Planctomycetia bacterium]